MNSTNDNSIIEQSRRAFEGLIRKHRLRDIEVTVVARPLTPEEAIGKPQRRDFPIIEGKERVIEARVLGMSGHAYTDSPGEFSGKIREVLELPLISNQDRAIYIATLNATMRYLNLVDGTVHCRDEDPELCATEISTFIMDRWGQTTVGLIGMNPAIAEALVRTFGSDNVRISDLNTDHIGTSRFGVRIMDGHTMTGTLIGQSRLILVSGTTLVNATFESIFDAIHSHGRNYLVYGVTASGISELAGLNRICPRGRNS